MIPTWARALALALSMSFCADHGAAAESDSVSSSVCLQRLLMAGNIQYSRPTVRTDLAKRLHAPDTHGRLPFELIVAVAVRRELDEGHLHRLLASFATQSAHHNYFRLVFYVNNGGEPANSPVRIESKRTLTFLERVQTKSNNGVLNPGVGNWKDALEQYLRHTHLSISVADATEEDVPRLMGVVRQNSAEAALAPPDRGMRRLITFFDADCEAPETYVEDVITRFATSDAKAVLMSLDFRFAPSGKNAELLWKRHFAFRRDLALSWLLTLSVPVNYRSGGPNLVIDEKTFREVGGFPPLESGADRVLASKVLSNVRFGFLSGTRVISADRAREDSYLGKQRAERLNEPSSREGTFGKNFAHAELGSSLHAQRTEVDAQIAGQIFARYGAPFDETHWNITVQRFHRRRRDPFERVLSDQLPSFHLLEVYSEGSSATATAFREWAEQSNLILFENALLPRLNAEDRAQLDRWTADEGLLIEREAETRLHFAINILENLSSNQPAVSGIPMFEQSKLDWMVEPVVSLWQEDPTTVLSALEARFPGVITVNRTAMEVARAHAWCRLYESFFSDEQRRRFSSELIRMRIEPGGQSRVQEESEPTQ